jgi:hypothetical protein
MIQATGLIFARNARIDYSKAPSDIQRARAFVLQPSIIFASNGHVYKSEDPYLECLSPASLYRLVLFLQVTPESTFQELPSRAGSWSHIHKPSYT